MKKLNSTKRGFTLIEIMVAIAVMAIMIVLGIYGANTLQRNARNSARKNIISEISNQINSFKINNQLSNYPNDSDVSFESSRFQILSTGDSIALVGSTAASTTTTSSGTKYFYSKVSGGYKLCARLEGGGIQNAGTISCSNLDI